MGNDSHRSPSVCTWQMVLLAADGDVCGGDDGYKPANVFAQTQIVEIQGAYTRVQLLDFHRIDAYIAEMACSADTDFCIHHRIVHQVARQ